MDNMWNLFSYSTQLKSMDSSAGSSTATKFGAKPADDAQQKSAPINEDTQMSSTDSQADEVPTTPSDVSDKSNHRLNSDASPHSVKRKRPKKPMEVTGDSSITQISAEALFIYRWPAGDRFAEEFVLQEQICAFLGVKSFKRKYPEIFRRAVDIKEREFLKAHGIVTEMQCDLGLTAIKVSDIIDIMIQDNPDKYQEYIEAQNKKRRQSVSDSHKSYNMPQVSQTKMTEFIKKSIRSAAAFNTRFQRERREDRRAFFDLHTMQIMYPAGRYHRLKPAETASGQYPVALIPGQFQNGFKDYTSDELKYIPLNTALFCAPRRTRYIPEDSGIPDPDLEDEKPPEVPGATNGAVPAGVEQTGAFEVVCSSCGDRQRPTYLTEEMVQYIKTYDWQCMDCKICSTCSNPDNEDQIVFCDRCDRGYHTFCVGLKKIPDGSWQCKTCPSTVPTSKDQPAGDSDSDAGEDSGDKSDEDSDEEKGKPGLRRSLRRKKKFRLTMPRRTR